MPDLYKTLGVAKDADAAAIRDRYRKQAKKYHPDRNVGNKRAADKFKALTEAYSVLIDPERRRRYDATGSTNNFTDLLRNVAMELLVKTWDHVLEIALLAGDERGRDMVGNVRAMLCQAGDQHREQLAALAKTKARLTAVADRIKIKDGKENLLVASVEQKIAGLDKAINRSKNEEAAAKLALTILEDYSFASDGSGAPAFVAPIFSMRLS